MRENYPDKMAEQEENLSPRKKPVVMYRPAAQVKRNKELVVGLLGERRYNTLRTMVSKLGELHRESRFFHLFFGQAFTADFSFVAQKPLVVSINCLGDSADSTCKFPKVIQLALHRNGADLLNPCAVLTMVVKECTWSTLTHDAKEWWNLRQLSWKKFTRTATPYVTVLRATQLFLSIAQALNADKPQENNVLFLHPFGSQMIPQGLQGFTCNAAWSESLLIALSRSLNRKPFPFKRYLAIGSEMPQHWFDSSLPWDQLGEQQQIDESFTEEKKQEGVSEVSPATSPTHSASSEILALINAVKTNLAQLEAAIEALSLE